MSLQGGAQHLHGLVDLGGGHVQVRDQPKALAASEQGHRLGEVATILMRNLDLSTTEREILRELTPP